LLIDARGAADFGSAMKAVSSYGRASARDEGALAAGAPRGSRIKKVVVPPTDRAPSVPPLASTICLAM